jgi:hypothetical protein
MKWNEIECHYVNGVSMKRESRGRRPTVPLQRAVVQSVQNCGPHRLSSLFPGGNRLPLVRLERHSDRMRPSSWQQNLPLFRCHSRQRRRWLYRFGPLAVLHAVSLRREDERAKKAARSIASSKGLVNRKSSARRKDLKRYPRFGICSLISLCGLRRAVGVSPSRSLVRPQTRIGPVCR